MRYLKVSARKKIREENRFVPVGENGEYANKLVNLDCICISSEQTFDDEDLYFVFYEDEWRQIYSIDFDFLSPKFD